MYECVIVFVCVARMLERGLGLLRVANGRGWTPRVSSRECVVQCVDWNNASVEAQTLKGVELW